MELPAERTQKEKTNRGLCHSSPGSVRKKKAGLPAFGEEREGGEGGSSSATRTGFLRKRTCQGEVERQHTHTHTYEAKRSKKNAKKGVHKKQAQTV